MRARLLFLLALTLPAVASATHQRDNLRDLRAEDLCPPVAYADLDGDEDEEFSTLLEGAFTRYARNQQLAWGKEDACFATPTLVLSTYEESGVGFVYSLELSLEVEGETTLRHGGRELHVESPQVWGTSYYGRYATDLQDIASREVRDIVEGFAGEWRDAHGK